MKSLMIVFVSLLSACASYEHKNLYDELGGQQNIAKIVDNFITEIEFNPIMFEYFKDSDIDRFREKLAEHICFLANGPCEYTGDNMQQVHEGMSISESDFNLGVDLLINAMDKVGVAHSTQNKLLKKMAPLRKEMIYL